MKSLVEETRITAVNCASSSGFYAGTQDLSSDEENSIDVDMTSDGDDAPPSTETVAVSLGRIYKKTLEILGDSLT